MPKMQEYLGKLKSSISAMGFTGTYFAMLSSGGMVTFDYAERYPTHTIESGPVAGVIGAMVVGGALGERNMIAPDGGSTTTREAPHDTDGEGALVACGDGETYIASVEVQERRMPILAERYCLNAEDGTGHGKFRGGFWIIRNCMVLCSEASFTVSIGRSEFPPWGVDGGCRGTPNYCTVYKHNEEPREVREVAALRLVRGGMVSLRSAEGGGWCFPLERDPKLVQWDVKNEYITIETARNIYGVALDPKTLEVDIEATRKLREEMRERRESRCY